MIMLMIIIIIITIPTTRHPNANEPNAIPTAPPVLTLSSSLSSVSLSSFA